MLNSVLLAFLSGAAQAVPNPLEAKSGKKIDKKTFEAAKAALKEAHMKKSVGGENTSPKIINCFGGFAPDIHVDYDWEAAFEDKFGMSPRDYIDGNYMTDSNGDIIKDEDGRAIPSPDVNEDGSRMC